MEESFKAEQSSSYAAEGTLAHEFGELFLRIATKQIKKAEYNKLIKLHRANPLYTDEMEEEVEKYSAFVLEDFEDAKRLDPAAILSIEERVDLTEYIPDGFGTNDAIIVASGALHINDLKYGKGIAVSADNNTQLKLYALGALSKYELLYEFHTVHLNIIQPRLDSYSTWSMSVKDLKKWAEEEVKVKAAAAFAGEGKVVPGDHCRFCKAKPRCRALAEVNLEIAKNDFAEPATLSDEEILDVYQKTKMLLDWTAAVGAYVLEEAKQGKKWEGYKLVAGRSVRKWVDETDTIKRLHDLGFEDSEIMSTKLKALGAMEKLVGKVKFASDLQDCVVKPQGKPTLVEESDKRMELGADCAKEDFKNK
jgi:hypothetical protein